MMLYLFSEVMDLLCLFKLEYESPLEKKVEKNG